MMMRVSGEFVWRPALATFRICLFSRSWDGHHSLTVYRCGSVGAVGIEGALSVTISD